MGMDFKGWNVNIIREFRESGGVVQEFGDRPLVILHSTGAKSGAKRENPLMYRKDDGRIIVFASRGGEAHNPDWYYNVLANPEVEIEFGDRTVKARAAEVTGAERDRLWADHKRQYPQFAEYEAATTRTIPVVALTPEG